LNFVLTKKAVPAERKNATLISICHYGEMSEYFSNCDALLLADGNHFSFHITKLAPLNIAHIKTLVFCVPAAGYRPSVNKEKEIVCPLAE
jgi:hypothetical protein